MSLHVTVTYVSAVISFAFGVALAVRLAGTDTDGRGAFKYLIIIPGFAGLSYIAMALNLGNVAGAGNVVVLPRYIDWVVTTPVLVGYVGYVAGAPRKWIGGVMAADALMILVGVAATAVAAPLKWVLFAVSGTFHLSLFYTLYAVFPKYVTKGTGKQGLFRLLQNHVGLLWLAYPLIWLVGAPGLGFVSAAGVSLIIAYLDVVAKVPYVYFVWNRRYVFDGVEGTPSSKQDASGPSVPQRAAAGDD